MRTFASVPPPPVYGGPVPHLALVIMALLPSLLRVILLIGSFALSLILNHCSTNLWRIIEQGFYPHDPNNFTPREEVDNQYNHSALFILQDAVPPEDLAHLRPFTRTKDCWEHIVSMYKGSSSIQCQTL